MSAEDLLLLDGVNAMLAMDTARAAVAAAVDSVRSGPELFSKHVDLAFAAMIRAGDDLMEFKEAALEAFLVGSRKV